MRKANANDLYPDRMVYYSGRVYQVEFRTRDTVRLVVPGQKSTMLYQPYPGSYTTFSRWDVPINSPLLFVEDELKMQLKTTGTQQWHLGDTIRVNRPGSKFHDWKGVVVDSYIACGKTWVQAFFDDISLEFCDSDVVLVSSVAA